MAAAFRFAASIFVIALPLSAQQYRSEMLSGLEWRDVGPMRAGALTP